MTCNKACDFIMLYCEERISPFKSIAMHRHIKNCESCKDLFIAMTTEVETLHSHVIPTGLEESVMSKIYAIPAYQPKSHTSTNWLHVAGCVYALLTAVILAVLFNTDIISINYSFNFSAINSAAFIDSLYNVAGLSTRILIIAVATLFTAIGIDMGKNTEGYEFE